MKTTIKILAQAESAILPSGVQKTTGSKRQSPNWQVFIIVPMDCKIGPHKHVLCYLMDGTSTSHGSYIHTWNPYFMLTWPDAMLINIRGMKNGLSRRSRCIEKASISDNCFQKHMGHFQAHSKKTKKDEAPIMIQLRSWHNMMTRLIKQSLNTFLFFLSNKLWKEP